MHYFISHLPFSFSSGQRVSFWQRNCSSLTPNTWTLLGLPVTANWLPGLQKHVCRSMVESCTPGSVTGHWGRTRTRGKASQSCRPEALPIKAGMGPWGGSQREDEALFPSDMTLCGCEDVNFFFYTNELNFFSEILFYQLIETKSQWMPGPISFS